MANNSDENVVFVSCDFLETVEVVKNFPSEKFKINIILAIVGNGILLLSTILLNGVSIITILKSSQLKSKPCYFIILVQSFIDLAAGVFSIPAFIIYLASQINGVSNCTTTFFALRIGFPPVGASIMTLSALTMERYIAILHPYTYLELVTKKKIVIYVASGSALVIIVSCLALLVRRLILYFSGVTIFVFFVFTTYAYTNIFLVVKRLNNSNSQNRPHDFAFNDSLKKRKVLFQDLKQAKSCFVVVMCFVACLFPTIVSGIFIPLKLLDKFDARIFRIWAINCVILNSSMNSVLFFWTKKMLRKEAGKVLKIMCLGDSARASK